MTKEQNLLAEGFWPCIVLSGEAGEASDKPGVLKARITVRIDDGPSKGRVCTYEDEINAKSSLYVQRSMRAVGWKTTKLATFASDVADWVANTGGKSSVEIKHIPIKNGKRAGEIWDKPNSIGRGPKPLATATGSALADAEEALRKAMEDDGVSFGGGGQSSLPADSDDIPFMTASASASLGEIAAVLK